MTEDPKLHEMRAEYRRLMDAYGSALTARDPTARTLFGHATALWRAMRQLDSDESRLDEDMHLVLALGFAVDARDELEAKRIYDAMSEESKRTTDGADAMVYGALKIWRR